MGKLNEKLEGARHLYRDALEAARASPSPDTWAKLLAAGKALSDAQESRGGRTGRRSRKAEPSASDLEEVANEEEGVEPREAEFE